MKKTGQDIKGLRIAVSRRVNQRAHNRVGRQGKSSHVNRGTSKQATESRTLMNIGSALVGSAVLCSTKPLSEGFWRGNEIQMRLHHVRNTCAHASSYVRKRPRPATRMPCRPTLRGSTTWQLHAPCGCKQFFRRAHGQLSNCQLEHVFIVPVHSGGSRSKPTATKTRSLDDPRIARGVVRRMRSAKTAVTGGQGVRCQGRPPPKKDAPAPCGLPARGMARKKRPPAHESARGRQEAPGARRSRRPPRRRHPPRCAPRMGRVPRSRP